MLGPVAHTRASVFALEGACALALAGEKSPFLFISRFGLDQGMLRPSALRGAPAFAVASELPLESCTLQNVWHYMSWRNAWTFGSRCGSELGPSMEAYSRFQYIAGFVELSLMKACSGCRPLLGLGPWPSHGSFFSTPVYYRTFGFVPDLSLMKACVGFRLRVGVSYRSFTLRDVRICAWWRYFRGFRSRCGSSVGTRMWALSLYLLIEGYKKISISFKNKLEFHPSEMCAKACSFCWDSGLRISTELCLHFCSLENVWKHTRHVRIGYSFVPGNWMLGARH